VIRANGIDARALLAIALPGLLVAGASFAAPDPGAPPPADSVSAEAAPRHEARHKPALEPLVPEVAGSPYHIDSGERAFTHRLSFSPAYGRLGSEPLYAFRFSYSPNAWLGYEGSIGHNPGQSVHAVLHTLDVILRHPLPGRLQPYLAGGYGMVMVFPGQSLNADPVTKNTLTAGGGLEFYIRNDLAIRADMRQASVFGKQKDRDGVVVYDYTQGTIGLAFYRSIQP
jgi:hypothetical protein